MSALATLLDTRREELLQRWTEALRRQVPGGVPAEVLAGLLHALVRAASERQPPSPAPAAPWPRPGGELEGLVRTYECLGEVVADALQESDSAPSPGDLRLLTRFITSGIIQALGTDPQGERAALVREAEDSRRMLDAVLKQMPSGVIAAEAPSGQLRFSNARLHQILHHAALPTHQVSDYAAYRALHPDGRPYTPEELPLIRALLHGESTREEDMQYERPDGSRVTLRCNAGPVRDAAGQVVAGVLTFLDITQWKAAEEAQQRRLRYHSLSADMGRALGQAVSEEAMLQTCTDAMVRHEGVALARIWLLEERAEVLVLKASSGLYGPTEGPDGWVPVGQFRVGRVARERAPVRTHSLPPSPSPQAPSEEAPEDLEWARREGLTAFAGYPLLVGERLLGVVALFSRTPLAPDALDMLKQTGDNIVLGLERLRNERERERALASEKASRQEAEEANRLKDEFLATVSHELRTPLTAMLGWVQVLRNGNLPPEKRDRAMETIERNARAQGQLIEDLLDVSRIMSGKLKLDVAPVEVSSVVEQALESVRPAADAKGLRIQTALDSTGNVMGDAHRLQQVVWNLLSNAVKFTPKGGRVQVFVERRDSSVEITVADTGPGIAPDFLPHVFERFRQAEGTLTRRAGGLGLGLSIVKQLVEMHGGTVSAFSAGVGKGTTLTVRLPLSVAMRREVTVPVALQQVHKGIQCPPELSGLRVLVVDDELDTRELLRTLLEGCKAQVTTAASVDEGLERLQRERPDVIVSDIGMPGEDGYSLISRLRALAPEGGGRTPAVALTAYARVEDRTRVLLAGFHSHVPKPVEPVELLAVLASLSGRFGAARS